MTKQWTATALVMALGLAAPVFAQDDPMPPQSDPTQEPADERTQPDPGMERETPAPADTSADREAAQQAGLNGEEYVVQSGDTLSGLAERFLGSADQWKQIADANGLQNPDMISVGQKLEIPQNGAAPASGSTDDEAAPEQQ